MRSSTGGRLLGVALGCTLIAAASGVGCDDPRAPIDPDGRRPRDLADEAATAQARLGAAHLGALLAATAGVTVEEAPGVLERWLGRSAPGRTLLARWARTSTGELDLDHAPVAAHEVRASLDHPSRAQCGEMLVLLRGAGPPSVRVRLPLPASTRACRAARTHGLDAALEGPAVFDALDEAIAAGRALDTTAAAP